MAEPLNETDVITILSTSGRPTLITGSSIQMPVQIQSSIATVPVNVVGGSITVGTVSVVVDVATVSDILTGTIATVQSVGGTVSVDVVGGTVSTNVLGTPLVEVTGVATVAGTVEANVLGTPPVSVQGIATVSQQAVSYSYQQTGLATIKATAGTLYDVILTGEAGLTAAAGTAVLLNGTGTIAVLAVPSGDMRQARFGPGVGFGTLIASIIGTVDLTVVYQ